MYKFTFATFITTNMYIRFLMRIWNMAFLVNCPLQFQLSFYWLSVDEKQTDAVFLMFNVRHTIS